MLVAYYDNKGNKLEKKLEVQNEVFKAKVNTALIAQAVDTYSSNQRQSNAHTKDRGEVSGGGKKPWRQKGTGRARVGSIRSPLWKGGGVTFGPKNNINYAKKLSKKMKQAAIRAGLSYQAAKENIVVYQDLVLKDKVKTKELLKLLQDFAKEKVMLVQETPSQALFNAAHNLENLTLQVVNELNVYDILKAHKLIILEPALARIYEFWGKTVKAKPAKIETIKETVKETVKAVKKVKPVSNKKD